MTLKLEDGTNFTPKKHHKVECGTHNFQTTWGKLNPIQQLAVEAGLDIAGDKCILETCEKGK